MEKYASRLRNLNWSVFEIMYILFWKLVGVLWIAIRRRKNEINDIYKRAE